MSDTSPAKKLAGIQQAWADPKARKGIIFGGVLLTAIGGLAMTMLGSSRSEKPQPPASATVTPPPYGQRDVTAQSPAPYQKLVVDVDNKRADEARSTSPTAAVLPTLTGLPTDEEQARMAAERGRQAALAQSQQQPNVRTTGQAVNPQPQQQGPSAEDQARNSQAYKTALQMLTKSAEVQGPFKAVFPPQPANDAAVQAGQAGAPGSAAGTHQQVAYDRPTAATPSKPMGPPMVRLGEIAFGTTDIAVNTDYTGPVSATVRQGSLSGARFMGEKKLEQGAVVIEFTMMSPPNGGPALPIKAYAVSLGDAQKFGQTGLEGDADYHIFTRYILPAAAAFAQSYGLSATQRGSTYVLNQGGAVVSQPGYTAQDRLLIGAGAAMTPILNDARRMAARPITVSLPANTEIGVLFAADVYAGGVMGASLPPTASSAAAQAQQAQQVQGPQTAAARMGLQAYPSAYPQAAPSAQVAATMPGYTGPTTGVVMPGNGVVMPGTSFAPPGGIPGAGY